MRIGTCNLKRRSVHTGVRHAILKLHGNEHETRGTNIAQKKFKFQTFLLPKLKFFHGHVSHGL